MSWLLDTNVVSEWVRPRPDAGVTAWLAVADEDRVHLSVVTLAELRQGIERLTDSTRQRRLDHWLRQDLLSRFDGRILPIDAGVAEAWGRIVARREAMGRPIHAMHAFIAATATLHGLTLVTRDARDFQFAVPAITNPWTDPPRPRA